MQAATSDRTARVVCLGEALVDLVCEQPVAGLGEAAAFVPRPGGSLANIAAGAARFGAPAAMIGGAGDDEWGGWLRERLAAEGVDVARFRLAGDAGTSHAFVAVSADGEPSFAFYGGPGEPSAQAGSDLDESLAGAPGVLVVGSDSIVGPTEREVTFRAIGLARDRGWEVLCDPNLRPPRWPNEATMIAEIRRLVAGASVVKCNLAEAQALTSRGTAAAALQGLLELGPRTAVVTLGPDGALAGGCATDDQPVAQGAAVAIPGERARQLIDATGAGDAVAAVCAAALAACGHPGILAALPVAMSAGARIVATWGALDGLPDPSEAQAALASALASLGRPTGPVA